MSGCRLFHSDNAIVYHKGGQSIKKVFNREKAIKEQINVMYTIWKCFPAHILIICLPFILMRSFLVLLISLATFRFNIFVILLLSKLRYYTRILPTALRARLQVKRDISVRNFVSHCDNSFKYDLRRFTNYLIFRQTSFLEKY